MYIFTIKSKHIIHLLKDLINDVRKLFGANILPVESAEVDNING